MRPRRSSDSDTSTLLIRRARALQEHLNRAVKGEATGVHQARVASRRLREAVPVLTAGHAGLGRRKTLRRLRQLTQTLGTLREYDVTLDLLHELGAQDVLPPKALDELRAHVEQERTRRCRRRLKRLARLDAKKLGQRLASIAGTVADGSARTWRTALARRTLVRARTLARAAADAGHLYEPDRLHDVRIGIKKLRYTLELARESGAAAARQPVRRLRAIQDVLGRLHDLQVLRQHVELVQAHGTPHVPDEERLAVGRWLDGECRHLHGRYIAMAPALDGIVKETRTIAATLARGPAARPLKAGASGRVRGDRAAANA